MTLSLQGRRLRVLKINPKIARLWLDQTKIKNRHVNWTIVHSYARAMKTGNWRPAGDPVRLDDAGNVLDGQKRLHAIIEADVELDMVVLDSATLDDQDVYDSGQERKAHQQLAMRHGWKNSTAVAAIARLVMRWQVGVIVSGSYRPSIQETTAFADRYRERMEAAVKAAMVVSQATALTRSLVGAFAFVAYDKAAESPEKFTTDKVNKFLELLATGAGLEENDPILVLRNQAFRMRSQNIKEPEHIELYRIIHTWKAWLKGKRYSKLQVNPPIAADRLTV